jgi:hypothetical protein
VMLAAPPTSTSNAPKPGTSGAVGNLTRFIYRFAQILYPITSTFSARWRAHSASRQTVTVRFSRGGQACLGREEGRDTTFVTPYPLAQIPYVFATAPYT